MLIVMLILMLISMGFDQFDCANQLNVDCDVDYWFRHFTPQLIVDYWFQLIVDYWFQLNVDYWFQLNDVDSGGQPRANRS